MSVPIVLLIILFVLMTVIGGKRGARSFFTLIVNFITLFVMLGIMTVGVDPVKVTVLGCIVITSTTLFYINGFNKKTLASLLSVIVVVLITILLTFRMAAGANIQGFSWEQAESISGLSTYIRLDFTRVVMCEILIGLLGAIIDVSISISSSMNELINNNTSVSKTVLLKSGINIGKDILGTMTNTLLFAYIGGFMTLIIWFYDLHYTASDIINAKIFCGEVFQILSSGIGIILIIPITAIISSRLLYISFPVRKADPRS